MRMWKVDPKLLCDRHLLGEHVEMHMFVGSMLKGMSIQGYIDKGLVETHHIVSRHDELVREMLDRGMNHHSPIKEIPLELRFPESGFGYVDGERNLQVLFARCLRCRNRISLFKTLERYGKWSMNFPDSTKELGEIAESFAIRGILTRELMLVKGGGVTIYRHTGK